MLKMPNVPLLPNNAEFVEIAEYAVFADVVGNADVAEIFQIAGFGETSNVDVSADFGEAA